MISYCTALRVASLLGIFKNLELVSQTSLIDAFRREEYKTK